MKRLLSAMIFLSLALAACTSTSTSTSGGKDGSDGDGDGSGSTWCTIARQMDEQSDEITDFLVNPTDLASVETFFAEMEDLADTAVEVAPSEIKADVQTVSAAFKALADALEKVNWDMAALTQQNPDAFKALQDPKIDAASDKIQAYNEKECGIEGDDTGVPSATPTPTDGSQGTDGTDGSQGTDGTDGSQGTDGTTLPDDFIEQLEALGLTKEQAECLSERLSDPATATDPDAVNAVFAACGIDPSMFTEGVPES